MRVFLYEYTCAVGQAGTLHSEGAAMLRAVTEDFVRVPGVETITLLEETCVDPLGHICRRVTRDREEEAFRQLACAADFTLVIAPEFDDILATRCRWVLDAGGRLLGSPPEVVTLAADKFRLGAGLTPPAVLIPKSERAAGLIPAVRAAVGGDEPRRSQESFFPGVIKPRFGAGSQATFLVRSASDLENVLLQAKNEMPSSEFILQPFVSGLPASVAFLIGPAGMVPLLPAAQHLSKDGRFRYQGGEIPLPANLAERARRLARRAVTAIPGLLGYIGIDLVLGEAEDGSQDHVIEINPRLTTSCIGLRRLALTNLARTLLDLMTEKTAVDLEWRPGKVRFLADGTVLY